MSENKSPSDREKRLIALLPIGSVLVAMGVALGSALDGPMGTIVGIALPAAGASILLFMILKLAQTRKERV